MCALHLTHPSAHTPVAVDTHTHSHSHTTLRCPGSSWGFGALLKGLTSVVDNSCRSREPTTSDYKSSALSIRPLSLSIITYSYTVLFHIQCGSVKSNAILIKIHKHINMFNKNTQTYKQTSRSARLLNSFFPQAVRALNSHHTAPLWNPKQPPPPTLPHHRKKLLNFYFCAIQMCYAQVSGPAQATCSNTLSSTCTRHFHTPLCIHNPTKDWL